MTDAAEDLAPGTVVAGRYRVDKCVGRGGMGAVYLVRHTNTDERLALKVLHATVLANAMAVERFRREARAPAQIDSDHVVRVTDADTAVELGGAPFLVMEFLKGQDLEHEIEQHGALSPERVVLYLKQTARALDKAHTLGIVHRDLKPENLFLAARDDGTPCIKILDFGIAKITGGSAPSLQSGGKTETGTITGTPMFMSPEQIRGDNANVTAATDIWALGLIAFRLLSAGQYWTAETLPMLVAQIAYEPLLPPSTRGVTLGVSFDEWFAKCCARDPAARFKTAGEAIEALEQALGLGRQSQPHHGHTAMAQTSPAVLMASPLAGSLQGASVSAAGAEPFVVKKGRGGLIGGALGLAVVVAVVGGVVFLQVRKGTTNATPTATAIPVSIQAATASPSSTTPVTVADTPTASATVRLSTPQPGGVRSARPTAVAVAVAVATSVAAPPLPPPPPPPLSATTSAKRPSDNDLLNAQHY